jgi:hypothetical protein
MRRILGLLVLSAGLWLAPASSADAQVSLSIGGPFGGGFGLGIGSNYGLYGSGFYPYTSGVGLGAWTAPYATPIGTSFVRTSYYGYGPGVASYSSSLPATTYYSSGYYGGTPAYWTAYGYPSYLYTSRYYPFGAYGFGRGFGGWGFR